MSQFEEGYHSERNRFQFYVERDGFDVANSKAEEILNIYHKTITLKRDPDSKVMRNLMLAGYARQHTIGSIHFLECIVDNIAPQINR